MSLATKLKKAKDLGITFAEGYQPKEEELDKLIEEKIKIADQEKAEAKIREENEKKAAEDARKNKVILKDVDGHDVDQADYFFPRENDEHIVVTNPDGSKTERTFKKTDQTAPIYFNKDCGMPVDREELIEVFLQYFPRKKGFLFYKQRDKEVYLIIVPLRYATTVSRANDSRPGDFQRHALSFISDGSVNIDSLKLKLDRIAKHTSIRQEPLA